MTPCDSQVVSAILIFFYFVNDVNAMKMMCRKNLGVTSHNLRNAQKLLQYLGMFDIDLLSGVKKNVSRFSSP